MLLICGVVPAFLVIYSFIYHSTWGRILSGRHPTFSGCLTSGILSGPTSPPSPDVSHPEFYLLTSHLLRMSHIRNSVRPTFHLIRIFHIWPDAGWERRAIQFPRSDMSGSSDNAYPESFRSRQFRFLGQLGSSATRNSLDPFPPTIFCSS